MRTNTKKITTGAKAQKALRAKIARLNTKIKAGKMLTPAERASLLELTGGDPITEERQPKLTAKNYVALAEILGVSRKTLYEWKRKKDAPKPRSNGLHNVEEWRMFCREHGLKHDRGEDSDMDALKMKKLIVEIAEREHRLATRRGEYVEVSAVAEQWTFHVSQACTLLANILENELPPMLASEDNAAVIRTEMGRVINEFRAALHEGDAEGEV